MPLSISITTPEKLVLECQVDSVVLPAWKGELGILQDHAPLVAQLEPGEIRLRTGPETQHFAVSGGFVEIKNNRVVVLAETAEMAQEIDLERAKQAAERARTAIHARVSDIDLADAEASLRRALARLRTAESSRRIASRRNRQDWQISSNKS